MFHRFNRVHHMIDSLDSDNKELTVEDLKNVVQLEDDAWDSLKEISVREKRPLYKTVNYIKCQKKKSVSFFGSA